MQRLIIQLALFVNFHQPINEDRSHLFVAFHAFSGLVAALYKPNCYILLKEAVCELALVDSFSSLSFSAFFRGSLSCGVGLLHGHSTLFAWTALQRASDPENLALPDWLLNE